MMNGLLQGAAKIQAMCVKAIRVGAARANRNSLFADFFRHFVFAFHQMDMAQCRMRLSIGVVHRDGDMCPSFHRGRGYLSVIGPATLQVEPMTKR
jgi:hypothetical protein